MQELGQMEYKEKNSGKGEKEVKDKCTPVRSQPVKKEQEPSRLNTRIEKKGDQEERRRESSPKKGTMTMALASVRALQEKNKGAARHPKPRAAPLKDPQKKRKRRRLTQYRLVQDKAREENQTRPVSLWTKKRSTRKSK